MPNHFHILVQLTRETDFSNTLRSLTTSYVKSFNKWHSRVGHLFQGSTKAKLIHEDNQLMHLCRYIHLNPVAAGLVRTPDAWVFSDYRFWTSETSDQGHPSTRLRRQFFGSADEYKKFVLDFARAQSTQKEIERLLFR